MAVVMESLEIIKAKMQALNITTTTTLGLVEADVLLQYMTMAASKYSDVQQSVVRVFAESDENARYRFLPLSFPKREGVLSDQQPQCFCRWRHIMTLFMHAGKQRGHTLIMYMISPLLNRSLKEIMDATDYQILCKHFDALEKVMPFSECQRRAAAAPHKKQPQRPIEVRMQDATNLIGTVSTGWGMFQTLESTIATATEEKEEVKNAMADMRQRLSDQKEALVVLLEKACGGVPKDFMAGIKNEDSLDIQDVE